MRSGSSGAPMTHGSAAHSEPGPSRLDILVVDDDRDTREMYAEYFRWQGCDVREAADTGSALELAFECPPSVIIMDLSLPQIGGVEAVQRLRRDPRTASVPVIICTAYLPGDRAIRALTAAGYNAYITKPVLPQELFTEIGRALHDPERSAGSRSRAGGSS